MRPNFNNFMKDILWKIIWNKKIKPWRLSKIKSTGYIHSWIPKWDENKIFQKETTLSISNSSYRTYVRTNFARKRPISVATHLPIAVALGREDITSRRDKQTDGQTIIFFGRTPKFCISENIREIFIITRTLSANFSRKLFSSSKELFFFAHVIFLLIKKTWDIYSRD